MNKKLKSLFVALAMVTILFALTGCGGNKLVATKSTEDSMMGNYKEKIEISFKDDKVDKVEWTMEFDKEESAKAASGLYQLASSEAKMEVKQSGKKVTIKMDAKAFASQGDIDEDAMSKDKMKERLEEQGYKVK